jgi:hypothetical protein
LGANFVCKCGFKCILILRFVYSSSEVPSQPEQLRLSHRALQFVKSLARNAGFHAPKGGVCLHETRLLLADEDCSKDLLVDTFGCDPYPTLVPSLVANFHTPWIHCL